MLYLEFFSIHLASGLSAGAAMIRSRRNLNFQALKTACMTATLCAHRWKAQVLNSCRRILRSYFGSDTQLLLTEVYQVMCRFANLQVYAVGE